MQMRVTIPRTTHLIFKHFHPKLQVEMELYVQHHQIEQAWHFIVRLKVTGYAFNWRYRIVTTFSSATET